MRSIFLCVVVLLLVGCSSIPVQMGPDRDRKFEVVGPSTGTASGFMLFQFIPIMQNSKIDRAYREAVNNRGGDAIINPKISESWYWAYIGNGYTTTIEGDVIRYTRENKVLSMP